MAYSANIIDKKWESDSKEKNTFPAEPKHTSDVVLSMKDITKAFGGQTVLNGASIDLHRGEIVLLRGENGAGKTTLINILTGNLMPDTGSIHTSINGFTQSMTFPKPKYIFGFSQNFSPETMSKKGIGRSWQDLRLFPSLDVISNVMTASDRQIGENPFAAVFTPRKVRRYERENKMKGEALLSKFGIDHISDASADKISLGQSKRTVIARAVQAGAKVLFLDEPLSGLDKIGIQQLIDFLKQLVRKHQMTLVIVEHTFNIQRLLPFVHTVWDIDKGMIKKRTSSEVMEEVNSKAPNNYIDLVSRTLGIKLSPDKQLLPGGAVLYKLMLKNDIDNSDYPLLSLSNPVVKRGQRIVIGTKQEQKFSFDLRSGEVAFLQAPNGWGKTTLLEAIMGMAPLESGFIQYKGKNIDKLTSWDRSSIGLSFLQSIDNVIPNVKVKEALTLVGAEKELPLFSKEQDRIVSSLSGGEKQKLAFICALAGDKPVLLLDEPFSSVDQEKIHLLVGRLKIKLENRQTAVLITSPLQIEN